MKQKNLMRHALDPFYLETELINQVCHAKELNLAWSVNHLAQKPCAVLSFVQGKEDESDDEGKVSKDCAFLFVQR